MKLQDGTMVWREVGDEVAVLDTSRSEYLRVNKAGAKLWPLLAEGATVTELVQALRSTFGISPDRAESDVSAFVDMLTDKGVLESPTPPGAGGE
jgi:hypothetical protein